MEAFFSHSCKAFRTESWRVSPPSTNVGMMFSFEKRESIFLLENRACLPSSILPSGQVIITDVRVKSEDILESKNAYKKAMQALTLYGNIDYVYYLLFEEITRDKYRVMCENEK